MYRYALRVQVDTKYRVSSTSYIVHRLCNEIKNDPVRIPSQTPMDAGSRLIQFIQIFEKSEIY